MIITFGQARTALADFAGKAGKCHTSDAVRLFVMEIIQQLLHKGAHGNLRKWDFCVTGGCFTAPPDLEIPLKVKINGYSEKVWSQWYEFSDVQNMDLADASFCSDGLYQEVNEFATIYELPAIGARISAIPLDDEENGSITFQGEDSHGKDVFTVHNGIRIHGETIKISRKEPVFTKTIFKRLSSWEKTLTNSHVRLYWQIYDPAQEKTLLRGLLAEIRPTETHPTYRRFRVSEAPTNRAVRVTVLGRVKMLDFYHDNDIIPVTNLAALRKMAQSIQADKNEKLDIARAHSLGADEMINDENQYYRNGEDPFDFEYDKSPGSNRPLI